MENLIEVRLRPGKDDDIKRALSEAITPESDRSDIVRKALRSYLLGNQINSDKRFYIPEDRTNTVLDRVKKDIDIESSLDSLLGDFS